MKGTWPWLCMPAILAAVVEAKGPKVQGQPKLYNQFYSKTLSQKRKKRKRRTKNQYWICIKTNKNWVKLNESKAWKAM